MHSGRAVSAGLLLATAALSQDFIHYKFESGCGTEVINYAAGPMALASNGTLASTTPGNPWIAGRFGGGLEGSDNRQSVSNAVQTGWMNPVHNGDITIAFFMRERVNPGTSLSYLWSGAGSFRMFTNGIANQGLYQRVIVASGGNGINGTTTQDLYLPTDVQTPAAAGWTHIALVVDSTAATATWFVNGAVDTVITGVGPVAINESGQVRIGQHTGASSSWSYDIDEFLVSLRAYQAAEVMALSLAPRSGEGDYDAAIPGQCGNVTLSSVNGGPFLGNANYGLQVTTPGAGFFSIVFGTNRCGFAAGVFPLPLMGGTLSPVLSGCWILTDADLGSVGSGIAGMPVTVPFPMPNNNSLLGVNAFSQALLLNGITGGIEASNGFAMSLGF